jgi:uncharacterized protein YggE
MMMAARAGAESTPINPGEQTLTVSVYASWHFLPTK